MALAMNGLKPQNSPVYKLAIEYKLAFPLHPEFRTMPMVWYCPPLSPIMSYFEGKMQDKTQI